MFLSKYNPNKNEREKFIFVGVFHLFSFMCFIAFEIRLTLKSFIRRSASTALFLER